jgi:hypothetical protein
VAMMNDLTKEITELLSKNLKTVKHGDRTHITGITETTKEIIALLEKRYLKGMENITLQYFSEKRKYKNNIRNITQGYVDQLQKIKAESDREREIYLKKQLRERL